MAECYYEPTPATDGASMNPVPGAVFQVFELSDTGFTTPLSLRVGAGNPTMTVAASESLATLPGVWVTSPNFEHLWVSGSFRWRRDSIDGAKAAIQDAKEAAVDAAASSDSSAQSSAVSAQAAQAAAALVDAPADTVMAGVAGNPDSQFAGQLSATIAKDRGEGLDIWDDYTVGTTLPETSYTAWIGGIDTALGNKATRTTIGTAVDGTSPIYSYAAGRIGAPEVILVSGVHGHEINAKHAAFRWFESLAKGTSHEMRALAQRVRVHWVPYLNPTGFNSTRYNSAGVDLNRNGDFYWQQATEPAIDFASGRGGKGNAAMSEPETQALKALIDTTNAACIIDAHMWNASGENVKLYPMSTWGAGGQRPLGYSFLERWNREYNASTEFTVAEPYSTPDPMLSNWAGEYMYLNKERHNSAAIVLELTEWTHDSTHTFTSRQFMRGYCGLIQSYVLEWLDHGQAPVRLRPLRWFAYRTQDHTDYAASLSAGGNLLDTELNTAFQFNISGKSSSSATRDPYIDIPIPAPGILYVTITSVLQSLVGTSTEQTVTQLLGLDRRTSLTQVPAVQGVGFVPISVPPGGLQVSATNTASFIIGTLQDNPVYRVAAFLRKASAASSNVQVRAVRMDVEWHPASGLDTTPYA